jgi:hypothetical protein
MKQFLVAFSFFLLLNGCAAEPYSGSAKCMEQADVAYESGTNINEEIEQECKATQVNKLNKEVNNHGIIEQSLLRAFVSALNSIFS